MNDDNLIDISNRWAERATSPRDLKGGGGGDNYDGMEQRVAKLEATVSSIEKRFDGLDRRLDRIEDKIPTEWAIAKVVFFVVGALMAAAIFGPRVVSMLQSGAP